MSLKNNTQLKKEIKNHAIFFIFGCVLGGIASELSPANYEGTMIIESSKFAGKSIEDSYSLLLKVNQFSYFNKENLLTCNIKNNHELKRIKKYIAPRTNYLAFKMKGNQEDLIRSCLVGIKDDIFKKQEEALGYLIRAKLEELKKLEDLEQKYFTTFTVANEVSKSAYAHQFFWNLISNITEQKIKIQDDLLRPNTKETELVADINIEKEQTLIGTFAMFGGFLGLIFRWLLLRFRV
jgi:hypothetical protein